MRYVIGQSLGGINNVTGIYSYGFSSAQPIPSSAMPSSSSSGSTPPTLAPFSSTTAPLATTPPPVTGEINTEDLPDLLVARGYPPPPHLRWPSQRPLLPHPPPSQRPALRILTMAQPLQRKTIPPRAKPKLVLPSFFSPLSCFFIGLSRSSSSHCFKLFFKTLTFFQYPPMV
jgi:hypothetical protein